jgi:glucose/arabinose dehydrogenase
MHDEPRRTLAALITHYGRALCDDPRRTEALLRDLCPEHRREVNVLVSGLRERVPVDLLAPSDGLPSAVLLGRLAQRLEDHVGLAPAAARWAVESWALALDVVTPAELEAMTAAPPPPPPSAASGSASAAGSAPPGPGPAAPPRSATPPPSQGAPPPSPGASPPPASPPPRAAAAPSPGSHASASAHSAPPAARVPPDLVPGSGTVVTVAGSGKRGFRDAPFLEAQFFDPLGLAIGPNGLIYVAEPAMGRVRILDRQGEVVSDPFGEPVAVFVNALEHVYVAERFGPVRVYLPPDYKPTDIDRPGRFAWLGSWGRSAGLVVAPDGVVYVGNEDGAQPGIDRIEPGKRHVKLGGSVFQRPAGLALDSAGNLYVADRAKHTVSALSPDGKINWVVGKSKFLGAGDYVDGPRESVCFNEPTGLARDARGRIYVADSGNHRIRRIESDLSVVTIAGSGRKGFANGPAPQAEFNTPRDVAIGSDGTIYVLDSGNYRVRAILTV